MIPLNPQEPFSPFLPTTYNIPEEDDRGKTFLQDQLAQHSDVINDKKIGTYLQAAEILNGEKWFYKVTQVTRNGYQVIAYIPSFPNSGVLVLTNSSTPQYPLVDINSQFVVTHVWGSASKPCSAVNAGDGDYFSFMAQGDSRISFTMTDTVITITTTTNLSLYSGFIVIEFLRNGV